MRIDIDFAEVVKIIHFYTMDDMFSKLGGLHALFFSVINLFAPIGMLYFLFNLSFYIKKHK